MLVQRHVKSAGLYMTAGWVLQARWDVIVWSIQCLWAFMPFLMVCFAYMLFPLLICFPRGVPMSEILAAWPPLLRSVCGAILGVLSQFGCTTCEKELSYLLAMPLFRFAERRCWPAAEVGEDFLPHWSEESVSKLLKDPPYLFLTNMHLTRSVSVHLDLDLNHKNI